MLRVGVIGGGQLARMMIAPASELGIDIRVFAEAEGSPAALAATIVGDYTDIETVLTFAREVDVVTFDHEHVPSAVLHALVDAGVRVHPGPDALVFAQDKLQMRKRLAEIGLPVPAWATVSTPGELDDFLREYGPRVVVKTPTGGYDGKGVRVVESSGDVAEWFGDASAAAPRALLVEQFVPFRRELAQLIARRPSGDSQLWPLVETTQRDGVCSEVVAPAPGASAELIAAAADIARRVADGLDVTGVLAVELFETADGGLLVNELAMRPHNSGHWTQDGAVTSQFEQHLRAVLDLPLGSAAPTRNVAVMINLLGGPAGGGLVDRYAGALEVAPEAKVHAYNKASRPGRKVGHVNLVGDDLESVRDRARRVAGVLLGDDAAAR